MDYRLADLINEYDDRSTSESKLVKDADTLELILTLKELAFKGNKEAELWLIGKTESDRDPYRKLKFLLTDVAKELGKEIYDTRPTEWWDGIWTNKNR